LAHLASATFEPAPEQSFSTVSSAFYEDGLTLPEGSSPELAERLIGCETTMTLDWVAARLCIGAATHVAGLLQPNSEEICSDTLWRLRVSLFAHLSHYLGMACLSE
jgi:hypothetical protein